MMAGGSGSLEVVAMPTHRGDFRVPLPTATAIRVCRAAVGEMGWQITGGNERFIACREPGSLAATYNISLIPDATNETSVRVDGIVQDAGSVQEDRVTSQIQAFRHRTE